MMMLCNGKVQILKHADVIRDFMARGYSLKAIYDDLHDRSAIGIKYVYFTRLVKRYILSCDAVSYQPNKPLIRKPIIASVDTIKRQPPIIKKQSDSNNYKTPKKIEPTITKDTIINDDDHHHQSHHKIITASSYRRDIRQSLRDAIIGNNNHDDFWEVADD